MFNIKENQTTVKKEILAGITTFFTMVYIVVVNPSILSGTGVPFDQVFTATIIAAVVGTLWMALSANFPIAIAPGMGLNAYFECQSSARPTAKFLTRQRSALFSRPVSSLLSYR
ncbi:Guanine/hypoxanthine permease PbuO [Bacillus paralicheniformis]|uniref:Guanine/hypoxanthine permease PbuO n=1 Tax=Bacillus paralicheniformis TaxID=1648923 RepID=A0ABY3G0J3_9BACI|nr:Guanine/hypoxanthine permease PbuO [Bacillus paralicheniformis]